MMEITNGRQRAPARCPWALSDALYIDYHDTEWGVPVHEDRRLFEFLVLEGAQAGLSWLTVLRKERITVPPSMTSIPLSWPTTTRKRSPGC